MSTIVLVDDPTFKGTGQAPQLIRTWAMRKLFEAGMEVGEIARKYGVPYAAAYRAINPPRKKAGVPGRPTATPTESFAKTKTSRLIEIASVHQFLRNPTGGQSLPNPAYVPARVQAAMDELDKRDPNWLENNPVK